MNYYEVYSAKTGEMLARGNAVECKRTLGFSSMDTFYATMKNVRKGRNKKYRVVTLKGGQTDYPVLGANDPIFKQRSGNDEV